MLGEPPPQVRLDLLQQVEVGQCVAAADPEECALGEGGPGAQVAPPGLAQPFHLDLEAEPGDGRVEAGEIVAESGGGHGQHAGGGADRVEELVSLPSQEGPVESMVLERGVEVSVAERGAIGPPVGGGDGRDQQRAAPPEAADQPRELPATGRQQQFLQER